MPHAASLGVERFALLGLLIATVCLLLSKESLSSLIFVQIVVAACINLSCEVLGLSRSGIGEDRHITVEEVLSYRG